MKIQTEIVHSLFIVTCDGPTLNTSLAQEFITAMKGFISKSNMDILLDLSKVKQVDSAGIVSIIRSLRKIAQCQLILCGVDERILGLLKMTQLDKDIAKSASRNETLSNIFWAKKNAAKTILPSPPVSPPEKDIIKEKNDVNIPEEAYAILLEVDDTSENNRNRHVPENTHDTVMLPVEDNDVAEVLLEEERRRHRRIEQKQIMNEEIIVYCQNTVTGRRHRAVLLNISPGGLLMASASNLSLGDKLLLEGRLGKYFKFKEYAVSRSCRDNNYGMEFINLSDNTVHFLDRLTGSVDMIQANRFRHDQTN